jgi:flagellar biosynthetic protein FliR
MLLWITAWVLIGLRALGVIAALPSPGGGNLPAPMRVALSMILAVLLVGVVPLPVQLEGADAIRLAVAATGEVLLGFAMGLVVRAAFSITALGGHQDILAAFARSFEFSPLGSYTLTAVAAERLIKVTANIFAVGLRIAAPFIALSFIINLGFSIMGKAVPRMNVFIASITVRLWGGLLLLVGFGALLLRNLDPLWQALPWDMLEVSLRSAAR